ncbi:MAG TPA: DPP IV N-terminal domain-containing protein, partial [Puia sp.]|nr:DPP IV N-terminal domain-containing protein [Puia sp.]
MKRLRHYSILLSLIFVSIGFSATAQLDDRMIWSDDGNSLYSSDDGAISVLSLADGKQQIIVSPQRLIPAGKKQALEIKSFAFSRDFRKILIYTNSKKVWRYETRGDYWVFDLSDSSLKQLGKSLPASSLMFAKFSPDGSRAAYVSGHNIYV